MDYRRKTARTSTSNTSVPKLRWPKSRSSEPIFAKIRSPNPTNRGEPDVKFSANFRNVLICPIPSSERNVTAVLLRIPQIRVSTAAEKTNVVWMMENGWMIMETGALRWWTNPNQQQTQPLGMKLSKATENEYCGTMVMGQRKFFFWLFVDSRCEKQI